MADLLLIDGHNLAFRCFYGIGELSRGDGFPTNAIFGWAKTIWGLQDVIRPRRIAVFFDLGRSALRREILPDYKAHRKPMPDALAMQLPPLKEVSELLGLLKIEREAVEADDLLASVAVREAALGSTVAIASADKDFCQVVDETIELWMPPPPKNASREWRPLTPRGVEEKFGVPPRCIVDYLSLLGDASDNIPGLDGVGAKTASRWLQRYGSIDGILQHADQLPQRQRDRLRDSEAQMLRNQRLIRFDLSHGAELPEIPAHSLENVEKLVTFFQRYDLYSLLGALKRRISPVKKEENGDDLRQTFLF